MTETELKPWQVGLARARAARKAQSAAEAMAKAIENAISGLNTGKATLVRERALEIPETALSAYLRSVRGEAPPRTAIKAFCMECVCWVRQEVTKCTSLACPLYAYRPFKRG